MRCFFTLLGMLLSFYVCAQSKVLIDHSSPNQLLIDYDLLKPSEKSYIDYVLSASSYEPSDLKPFSVGYHKTIVLQKDNDAHTLTFDFALEDVISNYLYRGFCVKAFLIPQKITLHIELSDSIHSILHAKKWETALYYPTTQFHRWHFKKSFKEGHSLQDVRYITVKNLIFSYDSANRKNFDLFRDDVSAYYKGVAELNRIAQSLSEVDTTRIALMQLYDIDLKNMKQRLERIENEQFKNNLPLTVTDPESFHVTLARVRSKMDQKHGFVSRMMKAVDDVFYGEGYDYFLRHDYESAMAYFKRAVTANPRNISAYYRMAEIFFITDQIDEAAQKVIQISNISATTSAEMPSNAKRLADQIQLQYIDKAFEEIYNEKFLDALKTLEKAELFCGKIDQIDCDGRINTGVAKAHYGLYVSYLTIARKAMENKRFDLAVKFIKDAGNYQQMHSNDIISNVKAENLMEEIVDYFINKAHNEIEKHHYQRAVSILENTYSFCDKNPFEGCYSKIDVVMNKAQTGLYRNVLDIIREYLEQNQLEKAQLVLDQAQAFEKKHQISSKAKIETADILSEINKKRYAQYIEEGVALKETGKDSLSLLKFLEARRIEKEFISQPSQELEAYIKAAALPQIEPLFLQAAIKIWGNDLGKAYILSDSINAMMDYYHLNEDAGLKAQRKQLIKNLEKQACSALDFNIRKALISANRLVEAREYVAAFEKLKPLLGDVKDKNCLQIDTANVHAFFDNYQSEYEKQMIINKAADAFFERRFEKLDSIVNSFAYMFYTDNIHEAEQAEINKPIISKIADMTTNCKLLADAVAFYSDLCAFSTLTLLKAAANAQCDKEDFSKAQMQTALKLARYDYGLNNRNHLSAIDHPEWFGVFKKHYKRQWFKEKWWPFSSGN